MMSDNSEAPATERRRAHGGLQQWANDPLRSVIAASGAVIGSFGIVLAGIGAVQLVVN